MGLGGRALGGGHHLGARRPWPAARFGRPVAWRHPAPRSVPLYLLGLGDVVVRRLVRPPRAGSDVGHGTTL
jgi:hypothetical protein